MSEFKKFDEGKPRMSLVPPWAIEGVARVMTHGEKKYDACNWLNPTKWSKFLDPALRHVNALEKSEDIDESGLPTVYHAIAELMMLATVMELKIGIDDRPMALFAKMKKAAEEKQEHPDCNATCRSSGDCNHVPIFPCSYKACTWCDDDSLTCSAGHQYDSIECSRVCRTKP